MASRDDGIPDDLECVIEMIEKIFESMLASHLGSQFASIISGMIGRADLRVQNKGQTWIV